MSNKAKAIICSLTFIFFALCLGGILIFAYAIEELNWLIASFFGVLMLVCIAAAVYILKKPNSVDQGYAHYLATEPEKIENSREKAHNRQQKRHTDFCIKDPELKKIITNPLFALDGKKLYSKIIASAAAVNISEDELINDIHLGEVFKCLYSLICIGNRYTLYCDPIHGIHFLISNDKIIKIYPIITEEEQYHINYFYICIDSDNYTYKMRCEEYMENEIIHYYLTIGRNLHHDCKISTLNY